MKYVIRVSKKKTYYLYVKLVHLLEETFNAIIITRVM